MSSPASSYIIDLDAYMFSRPDAGTGEIAEEACILQLPKLATTRSTKRRRRQGQFFQPSPPSSGASSPSLSWSSLSSSSDSDPEPSSPCALPFSPPPTPLSPIVSISRAKTACATSPPLLVRLTSMQSHALPSPTPPLTPSLPSAPPLMPAPLANTRVRPAASRRRSSRAHPSALTSASSSASYARRRNIAKLARMLGEPIPTELVRAAPRRASSLRPRPCTQGSKKKRPRMIDEFGYLATGPVLDSSTVSTVSTISSTSTGRVFIRPPRRAPIPEVWMQIRVCTTSSIDTSPALSTCAIVPFPTSAPVATTHTTGLGHGHTYARSQQLSHVSARSRDSRLLPPHARAHSEPHSIQLHQAPSSSTSSAHPASLSCLVSAAPASAPFLFDVAGFDDAIATRLCPLDVPPFSTLHPPFVLEEGGMHGEHGELLNRCGTPTTLYGAWNCTDMGAVRRGLRGLRGGR